MRSLQRLLFSRLKTLGFIGDMFQLSDHLCDPPLDPSQQVLVFLVLRTSELGAAPWVGYNKGRTSLDATQKVKNLLLSCWPCYFNLLQMVAEKANLLCRECLLLAHAFHPPEPPGPSLQD